MMMAVAGLVEAAGDGERMRSRPMSDEVYPSPLTMTMWTMKVWGRRMRSLLEEEEQEEAEVALTAWMMVGGCVDSDDDTDERSQQSHLVSQCSVHVYLHMHILTHDDVGEMMGQCHETNSCLDDESWVDEQYCESKMMSKVDCESKYRRWEAHRNGASHDPVHNDRDEREEAHYDDDDDDVSQVEGNQPDCLDVGILVVVVVVVGNTDDDHEDHDHDAVDASHHTQKE